MNIVHTGMRCEPADTIIKLFGGLSAVSEITGVTPHSVMRWRYPETAGGTGGAIPFRHVPALLEAAKAKGISLSADDFLPPSEAGAPESASAA